MEKTKINDFIEIDFLGKANGAVFDTNLKEEAKKINPDAEITPLMVCIGQDMVVKGFDKALQDKEIGKKYSIAINAEEAFGKRDSGLIKLIPKKIFIEQRMNPVAGMTIALDNNLAKIVSSSGGRVLVDFNHPLAGKDIEYDFTVKRIISDIKEKVNALQDFLFKQRFEFDIDEKTKKIIFKETKLMPILNVFNERFKNVLGYDLEIFENKKETKKD